MKNVKEKRSNCEWLLDNYGWEFFEYQPEAFLLRFTKEEFTINIWLSKMTIAIIYKGKQYFYKKISEAKLELILKNPEEYSK